MDDEWGLSMEELDSLENNAKKQLADRQRSSSTASVPPSGPSYAGQYSYQRLPAFSSPMKQMPHSPAKSLGEINKIVVKIFIDNPGRIGVQAAYNKVNSAACIVPSLIIKPFINLVGVVEFFTFTGVFSCIITSNVR